MILEIFDDNDGDIDVLELLLPLKLRLLIDTATLYILDPMSYYHTLNYRLCSFSLPDGPCQCGSKRKEPTGTIYQRTPNEVYREVFLLRVCAMVIRQLYVNDNTFIVCIQLNTDS